MYFTESKQLEFFTKLQSYLGDSAQIERIKVFLCIMDAERHSETLEVNDVAERLDMCSASTSRNLSALGDWHYRQKEGSKVITLVPMLSDRRRKTIKLTPKGRELADLIDTYLPNIK